MVAGLVEESVPSRLVGVPDREEGIRGRLCSDSLSWRATSSK